MTFERIDFISSYCDRWCERCAFTSRCSVFAVEAAIAMCGDERDGFELALGNPLPAGPEEPAPDRAGWIEAANSGELSPEERAAHDRRARARKARINDTAIAQIAGAYAVMAWRWLRDRDAAAEDGADAVLKEALSIVAHDALLIGAKLNRALDGRDRRMHEGDEGEDPVQNDANGSAKVALISIARSVDAWRAIGAGTEDAAPAMFADQLVDLRHEVEAMFPDAWSFIRPGFDQAGSDPATSA